MDIMIFLQQLNTSPATGERETLKKQLAAYVNELLLHDFSSLVQLLYRVDVPEQKLKTALKENPHQDAGNVIAELIIQRQQEKYLSRKNFASSSSKMDDEEKW